MNSPINNFGEVLLLPSVCVCLRVYIRSIVRARTCRDWCEQTVLYLMFLSGVVFPPPSPWHLWCGGRRRGKLKRYSVYFVGTMSRFFH